uniref:phenylalanyl tRNA synthetase beta subunit n=1 Tax=Scytothamnus australis TaxID=66621 RepID=UPI002E7A5AE9|nr:phenylalanyl tRNA synthetase beta subunit [Scytothamnus australis]WAM64805.1 phenylalanyl tRNA synthetase beta subunit [Scytothamnus australis]
MYISLKWVQTLISLDTLTLTDFLNRLTLAGFEVESITKKSDFKSNDLILDVSITANRDDVSNIKGLINEIVSLFNSKFFLETPTNIKPLILVKLSPKNLSAAKNFYLQSNNTKTLVKKKHFKSFNYYKILERKYSLWESYLQKKSFSKTIKTLNSENSIYLNKYVTLFTTKSKQFEIKESSYWIKKRLLSMNFKPINNIIDTINYIMLETGQIFFAYDLNSLQEIASDIVVIPEYAKDNDSFAITKSETIELNKNILVLKINNQIISIAGLIQSFSNLVNRNTSRVLLQCALYNSKEIKKSSKILGLRTEYSGRLEKHTDLNLIEQAYLRLIHLFWSQNISFDPIFVSQNTSFPFLRHSSLFYNYIKRSQQIIKFSYKNLNRVIGPAKKFTMLSNLQIKKNLKLLNFRVSFETDQNCYVIIPLSRRFDINQEIDIIEEIVRIIGFDKFKSLPLTKNNYGQLTKIEKCKRELRSYFLNIGFNESIHSILVNHDSVNKIKLKNPLFNDSSLLRGSLLDGLIKKMTLNKKNTGENFEIFELGRIYELLPSGNKKEVEVLSGIFGGKILLSNWGIKNSSLNWFEAKGMLENLFRKLNISLFVKWHSPTSCPMKFHPNLTTELFIKNQKLGTFGQIHPRLALENNLSKKTYLFELKIGILNHFLQRETLINYLPYSSYPISYVDLSCIVNKNILSEEIRRIIYEFGQPLLKSISLFDYYSKKPIKNGYCSLSFKLQFQSQIRTLSNEEVANVINPIVIYLQKHYDIVFKK